MFSYTILLLDGNSNMLLLNNSAALHGGALFSTINSTVIFRENASVKFNNNLASYGGTAYIIDNSHIVVKENAIAVFTSTVQYTMVDPFLLEKTLKSHLKEILLQRSTIIMLTVKVQPYTLLETLHLQLKETLQ